MAARRVVFSSADKVLIAYWALLFATACSATESTPECGKIDESLRGRDPRVEVPWAASIFYQSSRCDFRLGTSGHGIIIGPTTVLMSGNFLWTSKNADAAKLLQHKPSNFVIAVGLKSRQPFQADQYTQFLKISSIRVHPKSYDKYSNQDFVLVHLENPIRFTSFVRPICLEASPDAALESINSTQKLGELSISGFRRGQLDSEPFGFLDSTICNSKLESEYQETNPAADLKRAQTPCGLSSKSQEDVRSWSGFGNGLIQTRFLDFSQIAKLNASPLIPNLCFQKGSAIITTYGGRWYLVGITTESLGSSCANTSYFVSLVTLKQNLLWILKNIWFSSNGFVCDDGQTVESSTVCNGFDDCEDGSDETENYCQATTCSALFNLFCHPCPSSDDGFKILQKTYNFSVATSSEEVKCPPLIQPAGSLLHCENPYLKARISCAHGSEPGTKAVFQCKTATPTLQSSYCVISCKDDGNWTDELKSYSCQPDKSQSTAPISDIVFESPKNKSAWINKVLISQSGSSSEDSSLEAWSPSQLTPIADKTGLSSSGSSRNCSGFINKPGLKIVCRDPESSRLTQCSRTVIPGTKAEFRCDPFYTPVYKAASVIKTCQSDGRWSYENRPFECTIDCGLPKNSLVGHIVNGQAADGAKWPWHAIIFRKSGKNGKLQYICGATLITARLLLTAAHCVTNREGIPLPVENFQLVLGATSNALDANSDDLNSQIMDISSIAVNEAYNSASFESDIAMIRLSKRANISAFVRPSCFPSTLTAHSELLHLSPGSRGQIVGFGFDESGNPSTQLKETSLPVVSYPNCFEVLKIQASSTMYCAGYTNGTAACNGDSGGGMFFEDDVAPRRYYLQGIISHGNRDKSTGLCDHNQYSIFTKVAAFKNWIYEVAIELDDDFK